MDICDWSWMTEGRSENVINILKINLHFASLNPAICYQAAEKKILCKCGLDSLPIAFPSHAAYRILI